MLRGFFSFPRHGSRAVQSQPLDSKRSETSRSEVRRPDSRLREFPWLSSLWSRLKDLGRARASQGRRFRRHRADGWFASFAGAIHAVERPAQRNSVFEACEPRLVLTPNVWLVGVDLQAAEHFYPNVENPAMIEFHRDGPTTNSLVVHFTTSGSATYQGMTSDYYLFATPYQVTTQAGMSSQLAVFRIWDDSQIEPTEQAVITLALSPYAPGSYSISEPSAQTFDIIDNDNVKIWVSSPDKIAEEEDTQSAYFRIRRDGPINVPVTVSFEVKPPPLSTATPGDDYGALYAPPGPGSVEIPVGWSFVDIHVVPVDDSIPEPPEEVVLYLLDPPPAGYTFCNRTEWVVIFDNDLPPEQHDADAQAEPLFCECLCSCERDRVTVNALTGDVSINHDQAGIPGLCPFSLNIPTARH